MNNISCLKYNYQPYKPNFKGGNVAKLTEQEIIAKLKQLEKSNNILAICHFWENLGPDKKTITVIKEFNEIFCKTLLDITKQYTQVLENIRLESKKLLETT